MTSKEDDTLPLPAVLSQELSADVTVDEDFIPTSQPQGSVCSKVSKNSETADKSTEESNCSGGLIDDTLPREIIINSTTFDKDRSEDFILDTEAKKIKITYPKEELSCKKKLPVFADNVNICQPQSNPLWETQTSQMPESPFSILNDSRAEVRQSEAANQEKSITEIIVNDSAETVDLESSPSKGVKSETANKLSVSCSVDSDVERCEEVQIFDNSSVLLLDQPGGSLILDGGENSIKKETSQNLYFVKTVEDSESDLQEQVNVVVSECTPSAVVDSSTAFQIKEEIVVASQVKENGISKEGLKEEGEMNQNVEGKSSSLVATRQIDFNLTVTCFVTINTKTKKVLQKFISKVNEHKKILAKPVDVDLISDHPSDKSKRYSTSSSGSVYSDKHGLPFPLPKRVSAVSDQTDSSEDDFGLLMKQKNKAFARVPWSNEYLLPLKLDELVQRSLDSQELSECPEEASTFQKPRRERNAEVLRLKKTVKSSSPDSKFSSRSSEEAAVKETPEPEVEEKVEEARGEEKAQCGRNDEREKSVSDAVVEGGGGAEETMSQTEVPKVEERTQQEEKASSVILCEGLSVLARWTDKRYYSGVLCGSLKNDRWEVKFDDGTSKVVREDFVMPTEWLKVGALVFALVDDKYESGQIIEVEKGRKEITYSVELDEEKKRISSKLSDLCLTDVMASIVKEKYKPLSATPKGKADIDFDNVLSGKRLREQRTPLRPPKTVQNGNSGPKKKSSSKAKKDEERGLQTIKETPESNSTGKGTKALRSSNGHLVEDKVISTDSPSGNEMGATPLRTTSDPSRSKPKPRTLSYARDDAPPVSSWLGPDGSPVAGPSGLQTRRQRTAKDKDKTDDAGEPPAKKSAIKEKRKRKMDDTAEHSVLKKSLKKGDIGTKARPKKR